MHSRLNVGAALAAVRLPHPQDLGSRTQMRHSRLATSLQARPAPAARLMQVPALLWPNAWHSPPP